DGIRDFHVTGVQTCALPIYLRHGIAREFDVDDRADDLYDFALVHWVGLHGAVQALRNGNAELLVKPRMGNREWGIVKSVSKAGRSEERRVGKEYRSRWCAQR